MGRRGGDTVPGLGNVGWRQWQRTPLDHGGTDVYRPPPPSRPALWSARLKKYQTNGGQHWATLRQANILPGGLVTSTCVLLCPDGLTECVNIRQRSVNWAWVSWKDVNSHGPSETLIDHITPTYRIEASVLPPADTIADHLTVIVRSPFNRPRRRPAPFNVRPQRKVNWDTVCLELYVDWSSVYHTAEVKGKVTEFVKLWWSVIDIHCLVKTVTVRLANYIALGTRITSSCKVWWTSEMRRSMSGGVLVPRQAKPIVSTSVISWKGC